MGGRAADPAPARHARRSIRFELIRLGAATVLACSLLVVLTAALGQVLSALGVRRSEAALAGILTSVTACPALLIAAWRWRYPDRGAAYLLVALALLAFVLAIALSTGRLP